MSFLSYLKNSVIAAGLLVSVNFGFNQYFDYSSGIMEKRLVEVASIVKKRKPGYPKLESILNNTKYEIDFNLLTPAWKSKIVLEELEQDFRDKMEYLVSDLSRKIEIGFGYDNVSKSKFREEVEEANKLLLSYGLFLDINEEVYLGLQEVFTDDDFLYGVKASFSKPLDYYFVWTARDYKMNDLDYAAKSYTRYKTTIIDQDFEEDKLNDIIAHEILRVFSGAKDTVIVKNENDIFQGGFNELEVYKNLLKKLSFDEFDTKKNLSEKRIVTINIGLDDISERYAKKQPVTQ